MWEECAKAGGVSKMGGVCKGRWSVERQVKRRVACAKAVARVLPLLLCVCLCVCCGGGGGGTKGVRTKGVAIVVVVVVV